jgi:hypothetical protein
MKTEVRICFDGNKVPGGASAVLETAGCGADVAVVDTRPVLGRLDAWVTLEASDPRLSTLLQLRVHGLSWLELRRDRYTEEELDRARLIILRSHGEAQVFGGPRMGTSYDMAHACSMCGAGARQTSALFIRGEELSILEGRGAAATYYSDILVDERLFEALDAVGARGLSFRSVYGVMEDGRQIKLRWRQLCAAHTLPPISPRSTGIERRGGCSVCGRSGYFSQMDEPPRLVYRPRDLERAEDVNVTWEWFEDWRFEGDVSEALFAYPWVLVTPRVRRVFRDAGVTSFDWLPVHIEDDGP